MTHIEKMKVEGPLHVVCQCDKCKAEKQEPVAWWNDTGTHIDLNVSGRGNPLYTRPPQREWVGLTDEQIDEIWRTHLHRDSRVRAIEAKLKEKNT